MQTTIQPKMLVYDSNTHKTINMKIDDIYQIHGYGYHISLIILYKSGYPWYVDLYVANNKNEEHSRLLYGIIVKHLTLSLSHVSFEEFPNILHGD